MKRIVRLTIILSLFAQLCHAQRVESFKDDKAVYETV